MMTEIDEANYEMIFLWRKHEPEHSISICEIKFYGWTYTHWLDELHVCIMSKGNDVNSFSDANWSN
jgi:hypothetical protein